MKYKIFIVCGYGNIGRRVCQLLKKNNESDIIVIDRNPLVVDKIFKDGFIGCLGDASRSQTLLESNIKSAYGIICTFSDDNLNALCVVSSKWLNPEVNVISRANKYQSVKKLKLAGAYKVIIFTYFKIYFFKILNNKMDLLIHSLSSFERDLCISEIKAINYSFLHNKQLIAVKNIADINIIALKKSNDITISNPSIYEFIDKTDSIVILSEKERAQYLREKIKILSFYNIFNKILTSFLGKKLLVYWIAILITFTYFVLFDNFLNWVLLPAPPFTVGHLLFSLISLFFAIFLIYISDKLDKKTDQNFLM